MLGTTHQMIALLAAFWAVTLYPVTLGPVLAVAALVAVMVGALTPDLDQPTANVWKRVIGGKIVGWLFTAFSGGHRHLTHSFVGIIGIGFLLRWGIASFVHPDVVPQALVLWWAFMIGYITHPIADTLTDMGVPWFWPVQLQIKLPPGPEEVRVTTGSFVEVVLVRGALVVVGTLLLLNHWQIVVALFQSPA